MLVVIVGNPADKYSSIFTLVPAPDITGLIAMSDVARSRFFLSIGRTPKRLTLSGVLIKSLDTLPMTRKQISGIEGASLSHIHVAASMFALTLDPINTT